MPALIGAWQVDPTTLAVKLDANAAAAAADTPGNWTIESDTVPVTVLAAARQTDQSIVHLTTPPALVWGRWYTITAAAAVTGGVAAATSCKAVVTVPAPNSAWGLIDYTSSTVVAGGYHFTIYLDAAFSVRVRRQNIATGAVDSTGALYQAGAPPEDPAGVHQAGHILIDPTDDRVVVVRSGYLTQLSGLVYKSASPYGIDFGSAATLPSGPSGHSNTYNRPVFLPDGTLILVADHQIATPALTGIYRYVGDGTSKTAAQLASGSWTTLFSHGHDGAGNYYNLYCGTPVARDIGGGAVRVAFAGVLYRPTGTAGAGERDWGLLYAYSDDQGATWRKADGTAITAGIDPYTLSTDAVLWPLRASALREPQLMLSQEGKPSIAVRPTQVSGTTITADSLSVFDWDGSTWLRTDLDDPLSGDVTNLNASIAVQRIGEEMHIFSNRDGTDDLGRTTSRIRWDYRRASTWTSIPVTVTKTDSYWSEFTPKPSIDENGTIYLAYARGRNTVFGDAATTGTALALDVLTGVANYPARRLIEGAQINYPARRVIEAPLDADYPARRSIVSPARAILVRERPPLRVSLDVEGPSGRHYRWAVDEPQPENVPTGLRWSSTMPGGYETLDVTLPRKPGIDYRDLDRLSTIRVRGAGGGPVGEYRLERAPRQSGDRIAISPSAVGWQAHLEDNKSAREIYVDRDLGRWGEPNTARRAALAGAHFAWNAHSTSPNPTSGAAELQQVIEGAWQDPTKPVVESIYDAGSCRIGRVLAAWRRGGTHPPNPADVAWFWRGALSDDPGDFTANYVDLRADGPGSLDIGGSSRYAALQTIYESPGGGSPYSGDGYQHAIIWWYVQVIGDHGLTLRGSDALDQGFYASDVVAHAVPKWAPLLRVTAESITPSSFILPQLAFPDPTTCAEIIRAATRYGLQDWAVWNDRTFWWHPRGEHARNWRSRVGPSGLEETGPQLDRLWESVIVSYQDVDGSTRTVGPPGSGADTEDPALKDSDPNNPANQLGIIRRDLLVMGIGTAGSATEVGRRFLEESKQLDTSGRSRHVGYVEDDHGVIYPYHAMRAGDTMTFTDADDPSPRRIVRVDHNADERGASLDLDAPPEGLQALLERLQVVLVPLGF